MRIKIEGPVTAERLMEALERATRTFQDVFGGDFVGFFGANLYVHAYTNDGQQVEVATKEGKEMLIRLPLTPGSIAKPALSDALKLERAAIAARAEAESKEREETQRETFEVQRAQYVRRAQMRAEQDERERKFQAIVAAFGENVIHDCNAVIQGVWEERRPVWPHGQKKGQLRAQPYLSLLEGHVLLYAGNRPGDGQKIKTPLSKTISHKLEFQTHWASPEWKEGAVPALAAVIEDYAKKLPDGSSSDQVGMALGNI